VKFSNHEEKVIVPEGKLTSITVTLRCRRNAAASKGDGPDASAGPFILRGSLRERLRMTDQGKEFA